MPDPKTYGELLAMWKHRAEVIQHCHYEAANRSFNWNYKLGLPAILLSSIAGTSIFATLQKEAIFQVKLATGIIVVASAAFSGLQTFLRLAERGEKHRSAGAGYAAIKRAIEQVEALPLESSLEKKEFLDAIRAQMEVLASTSPEVARDLSLELNDAGM